MTQGLPFSVNHYLCPPSMAPGDFLDRIANRGFSGVGVTQALLQALPAPDLARGLRQRQLATTSVNSAGFFLYEGDAARAQDAINLGLLEQTRALGLTRLNVIVGASATRPLAQAREIAEERLRAFALQAAQQGVQLMVEPLHHLNVRGKSCFNSIAQLEPIFERIPGLLLNADLFHLWWDPDLERLLRGDSVPLGLLQICDVAMGEAPSLPHRVPLNEGFVPWADHVRTVQKAFPSVPIELELFADQLPGRALDEILDRSAQALTTFLEP